MRTSMLTNTWALALVLCLMLIAFSHTSLSPQTQTTGQMNSGGISSGVDPDGIRRSTNYAIVDSIGQFVVSASASANYQIEHGYWSSVPDVKDIGILSEAKGYADGTLVRTTGKIATAGSGMFESRFYLEESDRSSGLQVRYGMLGGPEMRVGYEVDVTGRLTTIDGERILEYPYLSVLSQNQPVPNPLLILSRDAGGGSLNQHTPGVWQGFGSHNIGLLVCIFGEVTYRNTTDGFFYVDDGCSIDDGSGLGIRVVCSDLAAGNTITLPAIGKTVSVRGIVSTAVVGSENVRCIRPREQSDIAVRYPVP